MAHGGHALACAGVASDAVSRLRDGGGTALRDTRAARKSLAGQPGRYFTVRLARAGGVERRANRHTQSPRPGSSARTPTAPICRSSSIRTGSSPAGTWWRCNRMGVWLHSWLRTSRSGHRQAAYRCVSGTGVTGESQRRSRVPRLASPGRGPQVAHARSQRHQRCMGRGGAGGRWQGICSARAGCDSAAAALIGRELTSALIFGQRHLPGLLSAPRLWTARRLLCRDGHCWPWT